MIDEFGLALTTFEADGSGQVVAHSEIWSATSAEPIAKGDQIKVVGVNGLTLTVRRLASALQEGDKQ